MTFQDRSNTGNNLALKAPVQAASTAALILSGTQTVDTVALVDGDRVLVKNQSTGADNGIYIVRSGSWERAPDWDGNGDVVKGTLVLVTDGTTNGNGIFEVTTTGPIIIGTTSVTLSSLPLLTATFATQTEVNAGASATVIVSPSTLAGRPSFSVHKNGTQQSDLTGGGVFTKVTYSTEAWDIGGYFANSTWTPPAGKYLITAAHVWTTTNAVADELLAIAIYKNGADIKQSFLYRTSTSTATNWMTALVDANGSDTFEIYAYKGGTGTGALSGASHETYFQGHSL